MQARKKPSVHRALFAFLLTLMLTLIFGVLIGSSGSVVDAQSGPLMLTPTWSDFQPQDWVTRAEITASVLVAPQQMTPSGALFRMRENANAVWSPWIGVASIAAIPDGHRLTTPSIGFPEGDTNQVQFRLSVGQNSFDSDAYLIRVDRTPPTVTLLAPANSIPSGFTVSWAGQDAGSGLPDTNVFNVYYRKYDETDWTSWLSDLPATTMSDIFGPDQPVTLQPGNRIELKVSARDRAGLIGESSIVTTTIVHPLYLPVILRNPAPPPAWTRAGSALNGQALRDLAVAGTNSNVLYAASQANGVYKSAPSCNNIQWSNIGPEGSYALSVLIDDDVPMVGTFGNSLFWQQGNGDWVQTNVGNAFVWALVKDDQGKLYAGTDAGVFRGQEQGRRWSPWHTGLSGAGLLVNDLWIDAPNNTIWAATFGGGVYRSPLGETSNWTPINRGLSGNALKVWSLMQDGNGMLAGTEAGVFKLENESWQSWGLSNQIVYSLAVSQAGVHYAGTRSGGVFMRTATANNWSMTDAPGWTGDMSVHDLLISIPCQVVFAATRDGVWKYPLGP